MIINECGNSFRYRYGDTQISKSDCTTQVRCTLNAFIQFATKQSASHQSCEITLNHIKSNKIAMIRSSGRVQFQVSQATLVCLSIFTTSGFVLLVMYSQVITVHSTLTHSRKKKQKANRVKLMHLTAS